MEIKLRVPYKSIEEGESRYYAIVSHMKSPCHIEDIDMGNGMSKSVVTQWEHYLDIDLWLVIFRFHWLGRHRKVNKF